MDNPKYPYSYIYLTKKYQTALLREQQHYGAITPYEAIEYLDSVMKNYLRAAKWTLEEFNAQTELYVTNADIEYALLIARLTAMK